MTTEICEYNNKIYGYVIRANENPESTKFYTDKDLDIQMGLVCHKANYIEPAHIHKKWDRVINETTEVLHVIDGKCRINFFEEDPNFAIGSVLLEEGDSILLMGSTGHNLETLTKFKGFKAKQGPYVSLKEDKVIL